MASEGATFGVAWIVIGLTPSPKSAHQRGSPEGGEANAKDA